MFITFCCQVMHDEVSETENIRKNLSIERQIVEGCEMLLDVNQIFIRQGTDVSTLSVTRKTGKFNTGHVWEEYL